MKLDLRTRPSKASKVYAVSLAVLLVLYGHAALTGSELNDDERDDWRETADRLFLAACQAISGDMNEATAKDSALAAVRKASK